MEILMISCLYCLRAVKWLTYMKTKYCAALISIVNVVFFSCAQSQSSRGNNEIVLGANNDLFKAVKDNNREGVEQALDDGAVPDARNCRGYTAWQLNLRDVYDVVRQNKILF